MRALFVLHDAASETGLIGAALRERGWQVDELVVVPQERHNQPNVTRSFPDSADYDLLVPMGAPWNANDDQHIGNWLRPELRWLADTVADGGAVFGICFGAQIMARALSGSVHRAPAPEIGWCTIDSDELAAGPWFQWHFDRLTAPDGATVLAANQAGTQAFQIGRSLGVQFHPEVTTACITRWSENAGSQHLRNLGMTVEAMIADADQHADAAPGRASALVSYYLNRVFPPKAGSTGRFADVS